MSFVLVLLSCHVIVPEDRTGKPESKPSNFRYRWSTKPCQSPAWGGSSSSFAMYVFFPTFTSETQSFSTFSLGYISWTECWLPLLLTDWLMKPAPISKLKLRLDYTMCEPGWDERGAWRKGMDVVEKVQVRDLGSVLVLRLVIWDRPLCPLPIKEEEIYPSPCCSTAPWHRNRGRRRRCLFGASTPPLCPGRAVESQ